MTRFIRVSFIVFFSISLQAMKKDSCSGIMQESTGYIHSWDSTLSDYSISRVKEEYDEQSSASDSPWDDTIPSYQYEEVNYPPDATSLKQEVTPEILKYVPLKIYNTIKNHPDLNDDEQRILLINVAATIKKDRDGTLKLTKEIEKTLPSKTMVGKNRVIILSNITTIILGFISGSTITIGIGWGICS